MPATNGQEDENGTVWVTILLPQSAVGAQCDALAERVVRALREQPATRAALQAAARATPDAPPYVELSALGGMAPPVGVPLLNLDICTLAVPAPRQDGVRAVAAVVREVAPDAEVTPETTYRTQ